MPIIETGHAKNVANFEDLISFVTGYGATYNPTKTAIKLVSLNALFTAAKANILDVTAKQSPSTMPPMQEYFYSILFVHYPHAL